MKKCQGTDVIKSLENEIACTVEQLLSWPVQSCIKFVKTDESTQLF